MAARRRRRRPLVPPRGRQALPLGRQAPPLGRQAPPLRRRAGSLLGAAAALASLVLLSVLVAEAGGHAAPAGDPLSHSVAQKHPRITLQATVPSRLDLPGKAGALPFPKVGQAAVGVAGVGLLGESPRERPHAIASITKMMTALLILRDHPLSGEEGGTVLTMTAADHLAWIRASEADESNVRIVAGERIDERQLLEALLIPSADNVADILARWDAGSIVAFAAKMNAEAKLLGLSGTHYADASGINPLSRSTASDQVILAGTAMANPVFRSIVDRHWAVIPVAGKVWNYNPVLGEDGIVGVKSGFTDQAEGCLVTAAWRVVAGRRVLVVSAAIGQPLGLGQAGEVDEALLNSASHLLSVRTVIADGRTVGIARDRLTGRESPVRLSGSTIALVGWPGLGVRVSLEASPPSQIPATAELPAGTTVGTLSVSTAGGADLVEPVVLARPLPAAR